MSVMTEREHLLYRLFDADGALLYVGITSDTAARFEHHRHNQPWWPNVAAVAVESHPTGDAVAAAEAQAIAVERPRHNVRAGGPIDVRVFRDGMGKKPMVRRTFYVPAKLWEAAKDRADAEESDISTVLRELLERYVAKGRK